MELVFKNNIGASKGKQCEQFLSILKKLKFLLSTKDRMLNFYVNKESRKFIITTYAQRNLQNPPAGSPLFFIDYEFGEDIYNLSSFSLNQPCMFSFQIQQMVRLINHYYETKMTIMRIEIASNMTTGTIQFQVPDQVEGGVPIIVQRLERFPSRKTYENKDYVDYIQLFQLSDENFEQLKEVEDIKFPCCYQLHEEGIFLKNYSENIEGNNFLLNRDFLSQYDPVSLKEKLRGNVFIEESENFLVEEIKVGIKKHYKKLVVNLIVVRRPEDMQIIRAAYVEIQAQLSLFQKTLKRVISNCQISTQINPEGLIVQQNMPLQTGNANLLKSQQPIIQGLRRVVMNKWAPRAVDYYEDRYELMREKQLLSEKDDIIEETKTRKIKFKIQEKY